MTVTIGPSLLHEVAEIDVNISDTVVVWERVVLARRTRSAAPVSFLPRPTSVESCAPLPS